MRFPAAVAASALLLLSHNLINAQPDTATRSGNVPLPIENTTVSERNARYTIEVRLDHEQRLLRGRQRLTWRNIVRESDELQFHLYWNAWRDVDSTWMRELRLSGGRMPARARDFGGIDVTSLRVDGGNGPVLDLSKQLRFIAPDDGNERDRTVFSVPLRTEPGTTIGIDIEWTARIPFPYIGRRIGWIDDFYFIAHWFPKIGVLEESGWNTHQFHQATEFFADYGTYDVRITVPQGFVVGASGVEQARTDSPDGTTTHRYTAEDVHDFAWTASPRFLESHRTFQHPSLPSVDMRLLLLPEHAGQEDRHFAATAATLKHYGEWFGAYPYANVTIVDPAYQSGSRGMEYPTLFVAGTRWLAPRGATVPEAVTAHEAGHQFWYALVGSNEFEDAWMDEGFTTFATARVIDEMRHPNQLALRFFGGFVPWVVQDIRLSRATDLNRLPGYRDAAEADEPATPTFRYWPATSGAISYNKTALWLHTLERHLGWPTLQRIMATYFARWKFRHPKPADFFAVVNEISGRDMTWFFDQVYRSSNVFDYGVQELQTQREGARYRTTVVARRYGEATFPVDVVTTFADGSSIRERWDGIARRSTYVYERSAPAVMTQVDPQRVLLLDVNYTNNSRTTAPRAGEASLKWSLAWMRWLQDLMLTYAFFV